MDPIDLIRDGKIRRYFRATKKFNVPNLVSHITQRAAGKEPSFLEDSDYLTMLGLLKEIAENYSLRMFAFCLMPNHVHLLFSPTEANLYDAMRDLFSRYATRFNRKYERKGHLFGGPYRQAVCLDDSYLLAASLYIHQNPVRAGLARDPLKYRWSTCRLFCEPGAPKSFVDSHFILRLLSKGEVSREEEYRRLLKQGGELETGHVIEQEDAIERFRSKLTTMFPSVFKRIANKRQIAAFSAIDLLDIGELEKQLEAMRTAKFPNKPESRKAKKHLIEQLIARGYNRGEIAERLCISRKSVYNILNSPM
ncbi:MAG: transposase [Thermodesulfobacteriota bacterium]|nr:transposase [Thermodesulfobacteriota bacterium]